MIFIYRIILVKQFLYDLCSDITYYEINFITSESNYAYIKDYWYRNIKKNNKKDIRYKINLGIKDYYNWQNLKDFLTEIYSLHPGDIYNVDVQQSKSFFNSKPVHKKLIIEGIKNLDFNGRKISVTVSNKRGQKDESSFSHRDQKKKRKSRKKHY